MTTPSSEPFSIVPAWRIAKLRARLAEAEARGRNPLDDGADIMHRALRRRFDKARTRLPRPQQPPHLPLVRKQPLPPARGPIRDYHDVVTLPADQLAAEMISAAGMLERYNNRLSLEAAGLLRAAAERLLTAP